jgi:hypothetical protein
VIESQEMCQNVCHVQFDEKGKRVSAKKQKTGLVDR